MKKKNGGKKNITAGKRKNWRKKMIDPYLR